MLALQLKTSLWVRKCSRLFQSGCWNTRFSSLTPGDANSWPTRQVFQGERLAELCAFRIWLPVKEMSIFSKLIKIATMMRRRSWQQKWKGASKKWILGSTILAELILISDRLSSLIFAIHIDVKLHTVLEICIYWDMQQCSYNMGTSLLVSAILLPLW